MSTVHVVDVAARDGLQGVKPWLNTPKKLELIHSLASAGIQTIEAGAFVHPQWVPQMRDSDLIATQLSQAISAGSAQHETKQNNSNASTNQCNYYFLIPNLKGFERSRSVDVDKWVFTISASAQHNQANINQSIDQSCQDLADIILRLPANSAANSALTVSISACFDCPFTGTMSMNAVVDLIGRIVELMQSSRVRWAINLADTTGKASAEAVNQLFTQVLKQYLHHPVAIEWGVSWS